MAEDDGLPVYRIRDIPQEPHTGVQRDLFWVQYTGTVQLVLPLPGAAWDDVKESDFVVKARADELSVKCKRSKEGRLLESLNGKLRREISLRKCWYSLEPDFSDPTGRGRALVVELAKKESGKPWTEGQIFAEELFRRRAFQWSQQQEEENESDWVTLKAGRTPDIEDRFVVSRERLCSEREQGQTDEVVQFRIVLDQKELDNALGRVRFYELFGVDCTERSFKLFIRGDETAPVLMGVLGGRILPSHTKMQLSRFSREVEGHRIRGTMEQVSALDVNLVKAEPGEWEELFECEEEPQGSLEDFERRHLRGQREPSPDREEWTPDDFADEQKAKADASYKEGSYRDAVVYYTRALRYTPTEPKLLSNRAQAYLRIGKFQLALEDVLQAESVEPDWPKIYFRKGHALKGLKRLDDAIMAFQIGQDMDPENREWEREIQRCREQQKLRLEKQAAAKSK